MSDPLGATFRKPFKQQVAAFRLRLGDLVPTAAWDDIERNAHDRGFMVAGALKADLLADLGAAMDRAISEGTGFEAFKKDFRSIVARRGWQGWTGEGTKGGENWRMRVIYNTNMQVSYQAGRMAQLRAGNYKYWVYRHGGSHDPRPEHLALDGLILPADHPLWSIWFPPNGWGCSCRVFGARTLKGAIRLGGNPAVPLPSGWNRPDPRTGVPKGMDKGWDYAPGATTADTIRVLTQKAVKWENVLAKEFMADLPARTVDDFAQSYRQQPTLQVETRRYVERALGQRGGKPITAGTLQPQRTLGRLTSRHVAELERLDAKTTGFDFSIEPNSVQHVSRRHSNAKVETSRGQRVVTPLDFARLPSLLDGGVEISEDEQYKSPRGGRTFLFRIPVDGEIWHAVFEARTRRRMLVLKTLYIKG